MLKADQAMYTDNKIHGIQKEFVIIIEEKLNILNNLPHKKDYVKTMDFQQFMHDYRDLRDCVDRVTESLLAGYKTEASHLLNNKVSKQEFESVNFTKFDRENGK